MINKFQDFAETVLTIVGAIGIVMVGILGAALLALMWIFIVVGLIFIVVGSIAIPVAVCTFVVKIIWNW